MVEATTSASDNSNSASYAMAQMERPYTPPPNSRCSDEDKKHDETKESEPCTPFKKGTAAILSDDEEGDNSDRPDDGTAPHMMNDTTNAFGAEEEEENYPADMPPR